MDIVGKTQCPREYFWESEAEIRLSYYYHGIQLSNIYTGSKITHDLIALFNLIQL